MDTFGQLQMLIVGNGIHFRLVEVSQELDYKKAPFTVTLAILHSVTDVGIYF